ncbi:MAG TPA: carboxypeptidase-like regulatory domain-containing protein, partial [Planctomycetota bacterium]|nr:carboxypeptidase-like regulatory domain-containing protein [Planctomycetota bacterium]
ADAARTRDDFVAPAPAEALTATNELAQPVFEAFDDATGTRLAPRIERGVEPDTELADPREAFILRVDGYRDAAHVVEPTSSRSNEAIPIRMTRLGVLEGRVICGRTGDEIVGARVDLRSAGEADRFAYTGTRGAYRFEGLERRAFDVEVSADGYFPGAVRALDAGGAYASRSGVDIALDPCARIVGVVRSPSRKPLERVLVSATGRGDLAAARTDRSGRYLLEASLRTGRYEVRCDGGDPIEVDAYEGQTARLDLVTGELGTYRGPDECVPPRPVADERGWSSTRRVTSSSSAPAARSRRP